jgi:hypothetical protein
MLAMTLSKLPTQNLNFILLNWESNIISLVGLFSHLLIQQISKHLVGAQWSTRQSPAHMELTFQGKLELIPLS